MAKFQYVTEAKEAAELLGESTDITIDGRVIAVRRPTPASLALLFAALGDADPDDVESIEPQHVGVLLDFFLSLLDHKDARHIKRRLMKWNDPFSLESIEGVFFDLIEEWSGHPTEESQDSTQQQPSIGSISSQDSPKQI